MAGNRVRRNMIVLFHQQFGECFYCKVEMFIRGDVPKAYQKLHQGEMGTFDHIILKSDGGGPSRDNGVCACHDCNGMRGDMDQKQFIANFKELQEQWFSRRRKKQERRDVNNSNRAANISNRAAKRENREMYKRINCYLAARYAVQSGQTVEDLFLEFVYNNTYQLVRDL